VTLIVSLTIIFVIVAVARGWFEIGASWGKAKLDIRRPVPARPSAALPAPTAETGAIEAAVPAIASEGVTAAESEVETKDSHDLLSYISARTIADLDRTYPLFSEGLEDASLEFWETDYLTRRANYGADNGRDAVCRLAMDHPTWVYPYVSLVDWSLNAKDYSSAEEFLALGLARQTSPRFESILSAGVKFHYKVNGLRSAVAFSAEWSKAMLPERIKAATFYTLADLLKEAGIVEGHRVALEWALALQPAERARSFGLAYSYADTPGHWPSTMRHYRRVIGVDRDGPVAHNNLGVLWGNLDPHVQIEVYEEAAEGGDVFATVNLARRLIDDGYIRAGERLLAKVEDADHAAELHANARSAALAARRKLIKSRTEIEAVATAQTDLFQRSLALALRHTQSGAPPALGFYASADGSVVMLVQSDTARCRLRVGQSEFEGALQYQGTCYAGSFGPPGVVALLTIYTNFTVLNEGNGQLRLFMWPTTVGVKQLATEFVLQRVEAPPPPPAVVLSPPINEEPNAFALPAPPSIHPPFNH
jgi:hypothetical protein